VPFDRGWPESQLTPNQGDLGHTDLQEDLEFHSSNFNTDTSGSSRKIPGSSPGLPPPATAGGGSSKRFLWTLSFYAQFFDVDTSSVLIPTFMGLFGLQQLWSSFCSWAAQSASTWPLQAKGISYTTSSC